MSLTGANTTPLGRLHPILAAKQQGSPTPGIKRDAGNANFDGKSLFDTTVHYYTKISYVLDFYFYVYQNQPLEIPDCCIIHPTNLIICFGLKFKTRTSFEGLN